MNDNEKEPEEQNTDNFIGETVEIEYVDEDDQCCSCHDPTTTTHVASSNHFMANGPLMNIPWHSVSFRDLLMFGIKFITVGSICTVLLTTGYMLMYMLASALVGTGVVGM